MISTRPEGARLIRLWRIDEERCRRAARLLGEGPDAEPWA
jgi:hypothetical protein